MAEFAMTYTMVYTKPIVAASLEEAGRVAKAQEAVERAMRVLAVRTTDELVAARSRGEVG
jgi:hypothetical protein